MATRSEAGTTDRSEASCTPLSMRKVAVKPCPYSIVEERPRRLCSPGRAWIPTTLYALIRIFIEKAVRVREPERKADANFSHETIYPTASAERGQPPPPARAAERGSAPQTDPHFCSCRLWENHAGQ